MAFKITFTNVVQHIPAILKWVTILMIAATMCYCSLQQIEMKKNCQEVRGEWVTIGSSASCHFSGVGQ